MNLFYKKMKLNMNLILINIRILHKIQLTVLISHTLIALDAVSNHVDNSTHLSSSGI